MAGEPCCTSMPPGAQGVPRGWSLLWSSALFPCICTWHSFKSLIETISLSRAEPWSSASTNSPATSKEWMTWVNCSWPQNLEELIAPFPPPLSHVEKAETQAWTQLQEAGKGGLVLLPGGRTAISHRWQSSLSTSLPLPKDAQRGCATRAQRDRNATDPFPPSEIESYRELCCSLKGLWLSDSWNASAPGCVSSSLFLKERQTWASSHTGAPLLFYQVSQSPCSTFMGFYVGFLHLQERR